MLSFVPPCLALVACRILEAEVNHFPPAVPQRGDPFLPRARFAGEWEADRFLVVHPGQQTAFSPDDHAAKSASIHPPVPSRAETRAPSAPL